jgi:geranylgeranyl reductase family protein
MDQLAPAVAPPIRQLEAEVAIIGAGPAGTATALRLGQLGVRNVLLVDRHDFPREKTCGSGISPKGIAVLRELGVWPEVERHALWIRGLRLVTPGDREVYLSAGRELDAVICPRRVLDHLLLQRAQSLGVTFIPDCTAVRLVEDQGRVVGFDARDGTRVKARYTVVAGGAHCTLTTKEAARPKRMIQAIMGWWENVPHRGDHVEMIFDKMLTPLYGWLFPESPTRVNIGITYEDPAREQRARQLFQRFLDKHFAERLAGARQLGKWQGHPIVYDYNVGQLTSPGRIVVGEAGRLTHPATAEGIAQGLRSGLLAASALQQVLTGHHERLAFAGYEWRCKQAFAASFAGAAAFRRLVRTPALDWLVAAGERPALKQLAARVLAWI